MVTLTSKVYFSQYFFDVLILYVRFMYESVLFCAGSTEWRR